MYVCRYVCMYVNIHTHTNRSLGKLWRGVWEDETIFATRTEDEPSFTNALKTTVQEANQTQVYHDLSLMQQNRRLTKEADQIKLYNREQQQHTTKHHTHI